MNLKFTGGQWAILVALGGMAALSVSAIALLLVFSTIRQPRVSIEDSSAVASRGLDAAEATPRTLVAVRLPPESTRTPTSQPSRTAMPTQAPTATSSPTPSHTATMQPTYDPCGVTVVLVTNVPSGVKFVMDGQVAENFEPSRYRFTGICTGFHIITYYYPFGDRFQIYVPDGYVEVEYAAYLQYQSGCFNCP